MIKKILIALVAIVVVFVIVAALQPADYRVVRSTTIAAAPSAVFAQANDLHRYQAWNPWAKLDAAAKYTHAGPASGTGASLAWEGNAQIGEGRMTIIESHPNDLIKMKLDFVKPFASTAGAEFTFKPEGSQTVVTWSMAGEKNFLSKAVCLFLNMDKEIGGAFDEGLASLKALSETAARK